MSNWTLQVVGLYSWVLFSFSELLLLQAHPSRGLQALKTLKDNKPSINKRNKRIFFLPFFKVSLCSAQHCYGASTIPIQYGDTVIGSVQRR